MRRLTPLVLAAAFAAACTSGGPTAPSVPPTGTVEGAGGVLVPHLVGVDRPQAETLLENRGLYVRIDARRVSGTDAVLAQRPRPDVRIPTHSLVVLRVDCTPAPCPAPPAGTTIFDPCSCAYR